MLVVSRGNEEAVVLFIGNHTQVTVKVLGIVIENGFQQVKLGFEAPGNVKILRGELI